MFLKQLVAPLTVIVVVGCASRPKPPPQDAVVSPPWGSWQEPTRITGTARAPGGDPAVLTLAGAGSRCAYGAGLLCGWSQAGTRPRFQVVTGVSLSAVMAVFAFMGPDGDDELREFFTGHSTRDFYRRLGLISAGVTGAINAQGPFTGLLERFITDDVLLAIAREHTAGRRLYIATTNLDGGMVTVWDMGAIASSDREDRLERFREILLASSSSPVLFPPVYIDVEVEGEQYWQMHVDGALLAPVFLRASMLDVAVGPRLFVILSDTLGHDLPYTRPVRPTLRSLASAYFNVLESASRAGAIYRIYVLATEASVDFKLAAIPEEYADPPRVEIFNPERLKTLFDFAYDQAATGDHWMTRPPGLQPRDLPD